MKSLAALLNLQMLYEFKRIMHILKNVVVDYKVDTLPLTYDQIFHCFSFPCEEESFPVAHHFFIFFEDGIVECDFLDMKDASVAADLFCVKSSLRERSNRSAVSNDETSTRI